MANDRPSSANNEEGKKTKPMNMMGIGREEMIVTGSSNSGGTAGKRRFPSSNSKQDPLSRFKWSDNNIFVFFNIYGYIP